MLHALRRKPEERFPSAQSFGAELENPGLVHVTGLSQRLQAPRWRLSLQGTPVLSGVLIGVGALAGLVGLFLLLMRHR